MDRGRVELVCIGLLLTLAAMQGYVVYLLWPEVLPGQWALPHWPWPQIGIFALELGAAAAWIVRWAKKNRPAPERRH